MKTRKIVQMAIDFSSDSSCPPYIYALCNDGTLWGINDKPDEKWRPLPSIPQPLQAGEVQRSCRVIRAAELLREPAQPPAPAPALPLDLDALLSPEGAYEPGTGQEDGAQLVDQLEWWAPVHGCETLENLLDRIRRRILPHLRPPIAGIDVPGTDGDYGGLQELCDAEGVDVRIGAPLLKRAREAWGATQPPAPVPAAEGEREELAQWLYSLAAERSCNRRRGIRPHPSALTRAAVLLQQAAPAPVPVTERPWERPGWCDAEGRCWWGRCADEIFNPEWALATYADIEEFCSDAMPSLTLPHWAIPTPQPPQGGEVQ